ncbi:unnamed protein product [Effrenium voratum]|uniref:Uncharacterized protein n=1 Tax=Effrenium voratum TaxID=2562239 RepID=A0AA36JII4_9DINO|nr:unnamed protein product [Effrenium voratum]
MSISFGNAGWSNVPIAGFYAGTQAYLIRPSGARKMLENIRGKPFQDIDMTMMASVKNYVWRRVLVQDRPDKDLDLLQTSAGSGAKTVPVCNRDPPSDQFWFDLIQHRALLCQMLLTQLQSWLSAAEEERLRVLLASLQLLGEVSETMRPHFLQLLRTPELIVESLLMNARVDLLKKFLEDFPEYRHDELILRYARKALALPPVLTEEAEEACEGTAVWVTGCLSQKE